MDNMVKTFVNEEFGSVRTIEENGKVLFCGSDVAKALGYRRPKDAINAHCKGAVKRRLLTNGGAQEMKMISEGDVYRLISHSRLPSAEKFESWIFDDVLPTIRRTGGYVTNEEMFIENYLPFLDEPYQNLFRLQMMAINQLNERIRHDEPLVDFAEQVSDTTNLMILSIKLDTLTARILKLSSDSHIIESQAINENADNRILWEFLKKIYTRDLVLGENSEQRKKIGRASCRERV